MHNLHDPLVRFPQQFYFSNFQIHRTKALLAIIL